MVGEGQKDRYFSDKGIFGQFFLERKIWGKCQDGQKGSRTLHNIIFGGLQ
jgi:hypothetical protein